MKEAPLTFRTLLRADGGYSLLEVLVALTVLSVATAVLGAAVPSWNAAGDLKRAALDIKLLFEEARTQSARESATVVVRFDAQQGSLVVNGHASVQLPRSVSLKLTGASTASASPIVVFFPDGSSTGAEALLAAGGHEVSLRVHWLTGVVDAL